MNDNKGREGESVVGRKRFKDKQQPQQQATPSTKQINHHHHRRCASLPNTQYGSFLSLFHPINRSVFSFIFFVY